MGYGAVKHAQQRSCEVRRNNASDEVFFGVRFGELFVSFQL